MGADLYSEGDGKIHCQRAADGAATCQFTWGEDLIAVDLQQHTTVQDSVVVWGEGAAGTHGPERSHWLPTDLSGVQGQAAVTWAGPGQPGTVSQGSAGESPRTRFDGAVRSAETAGDLASAQAQVIALRPMVGEVQALGRPEVLPGEWVDLLDIPAGETQGGATVSLKLRVRRVNHHFSTDAGLLTRLAF